MTTEQDHIVCPHCGSDWTHHGTVEVYSRRPHHAYRADPDDEQEDTPVICTAVSLSGNICTGDPEKNPSDRRGGVRIRFRCEQCDKPFALTIAQHKGQTMTTLA